LLNSYNLWITGGPQATAATQVPPTKII